MNFQEAHKKLNEMIGDFNSITYKLTTFHDGTTEQECCLYSGAKGESILVSANTWDGAFAKLEDKREGNVVEVVEDFEELQQA